ncbi:MAG: sodium:solute symporter, partial [Bacteroidota bacterium]
IFFIPIYYKLKVFTAYEYLESRFDLKTRMLGASLFLLQRGLAAGITIYAPAIIISTILEWNLTLTILLVGILVIVYTYSGGSRAVSITQKHQMTVILIGMLMAFGIMLYHLSDHLSFGEALSVAGSLGKLEAIDLDFNFEKRYTVWSGLTGGLFLALSYFGTDQSQVQRYIGGKSIAESRMGLMFNAVLKIPMQFFILLIGVMLYVFYIFFSPPLHFKEQSVIALQEAGKGVEVRMMQEEYQVLVDKREEIAAQLPVLKQKLASEALQQVQVGRLQYYDNRIKAKRQKFKDLIQSVNGDIKTKDSDYVFLTFILNYLPHGLIGLLIAVIFSAAMSSTSSEINSLASTTAIDFYKRVVNPDGTDVQFLKVSKLLTLGWGIIAILFAIIADNAENLIEAVNIIGSIFYGTILGIFLVAFFFKRIGGSAVFFGAILAEVLVITCHLLNEMEVIDLGYLWYNAIGLLVTILISHLLQLFFKNEKV